MSRTAALLFALAAACCSWQAAQPPAPERVTVRLTSLGGGWCTGFPVERSGKWTVVATAKHCLRNVLTNATPVFIHPNLDAALVLMRSSQTPRPLRLRTLANHERPQVLVYGFPKIPKGSGSVTSITDGRIAGSFGNGTFRLTAPIWFGNSGGPVLDLHGNVVCLVSGVWPGLDGWGACVGAGEVRKMLDAL
jgi:hypothetical protein